MAESDFSGLVKIEELLELQAAHAHPARENKKPVVGWFCAYTPVEILLAAGLQPYRIVPRPGRASVVADSYIDRSFCPYVRTCLGEALEGAYGFLDGLVVVNSCDAMRRLYDAWRYYVGGEGVFLLDLPRQDTPVAVDYYRECLLGLTAELERHFNVGITPAEVAAAAVEVDRARLMLRELYELNSNGGLRIPATRLQRVVRASTVLPPETFIPALGRLLDEVKSAVPAPASGPRVLVAGSVLDNPLILEMIEGCGAVVAADDLCTGTRQFWQTAGIVEEPLGDLSRYYLGRAPCPRMKDGGRRFDHILRLIDEFYVDGVIFYTLKFCDPCLFDIPIIKAQLAGRGVPCLLLEGDYTPGTLGRVRTRIEAFVEMLGEHVRTA